jgi:antitoxin (DNA-binding transcriptional repressor) of toxin-antitoxin stability system
MKWIEDQLKADARLAREVDEALTQMRIGQDLAARRGSIRDALLTRRRRPVAAVVPLDDEDFFSMRLASDPQFIETIERARARYAANGGRSLAEIRRKHGLESKTPPRRRTASGKSR